MNVANAVALQIFFASDQCRIISFCHKIYVFFGRPSGLGDCVAVTTVVIIIIIIMSRQFLRRHNTVTDLRAPYKPVL